MFGAFPPRRAVLGQAFADSAVTTVRACVSIGAASTATVELAAAPSADRALEAECCCLPGHRRADGGGDRSANGRLGDQAGRHMERRERPGLQRLREPDRPDHLPVHRASARRDRASYVHGTDREADKKSRGGAALLLQLRGRHAPRSAPHWRDQRRLRRDVDYIEGEPKPTATDEARIFAYDGSGSLDLRPYDPRAPPRTLYTDVNHGLHDDLDTVDYGPRAGETEASAARTRASSCPVPRGARPPSSSAGTWPFPATRAWPRHQAGSSPRANSGSTTWCRKAGGGGAASDERLDGDHRGRHVRQPRRRHAARGARARYRRGAARVPARGRHAGRPSMVEHIRRRPAATSATAVRSAFNIARSRPTASACMSTRS